MRYDTKVSLVILTLIISVLAGCQQSRKKPMVDGGGLDDSGFGSSDALGNAFNLGNANNFTEADKAAISKLAQQTDAIKPKADTGLSPDLMAQLMELFNQDPDSIEVSAQKYALAGKILMECAAKLSQPALTPQPGDPLMGTYSMFETNTEGFAADRGLKTTIDRQGSALVLNSPYCFGGAALAVTPDGTATAGVCILPDSGYNTSPITFTDKPQAASGDYHGYNTAGDFYVWTFFNMESSKNPIPGKYDEAMKQGSLCYRQALFLLSGISAQVIKESSPAVGSAIRKNLMGLPK